MLEQDKENVRLIKNLSIEEKFNPDIEPLLCDNPNRYVVFPIEYPNIWSLYKQAEATFWTTEEIDISKDIKDWQTLSHSEQQYISHLLATLGVSVGLLEDSVEDLSREIKVTEALCFFGLQIAVEGIHSELYTLIIDNYVKDLTEKERLFGCTESLPFVKKKIDWAQQWMNSETTTFVERLVAVAAMESVLFAGAFATMFWLKKRNILPGLTKANEHIARDEEVNRDFVCLLFSYVVQKPSKENIARIIKSAVQFEQQYLSQILPADLTEINIQQMKSYVEHVANKLSCDLGCEKLYATKNPFDFIPDSLTATKEIKAMAIRKEDFDIGDDFKTDADF